MKRSRPLRVGKYMFKPDKGIEDVIVAPANFDRIEMQVPKPIEAQPRDGRVSMIGNETSMEMQTIRYFPAARAIQPGMMQYEIESKVILRRAWENDIRREAMAEDSVFGGGPGVDVDFEVVDNSEEEQYLGSIEDQVDWET